MDPSLSSFGGAEGVPPNQQATNLQPATRNNLPAQKPIHGNSSSNSDQKTSKPVAAIKPVVKSVKPQAQKPLSRAQYSNQWKTPSSPPNNAPIPQMTAGFEDDVFPQQQITKIAYVIEPTRSPDVTIPTEESTDQQEWGSFNLNTVENVLRKTSLTKPSANAHFVHHKINKNRTNPNRNSDHERSFIELENELNEPDTHHVRHNSSSIIRTETLETDPAQLPKKRRSIPPPAPSRRSQSYSDLTDSPDIGGSHIRPSVHHSSKVPDTNQTPPNVPVRNTSHHHHHHHHHNQSPMMTSSVTSHDGKLIGNKDIPECLQRFVANRQGGNRRSIEKTGSLERQKKVPFVDELKKSHDDLLSTSSNSSTSPDRNIRQRTEVMPSEPLKSPLNGPRPYIRSNLQTGRMKPLNHRSASQPSLNNSHRPTDRMTSRPISESQDRLAGGPGTEPGTDSSLRRKKSDTRVRYPMIVPNDENSNGPSTNSESSPEIEHRTATTDRSPGNNELKNDRPVSFNLPKSKHILQFPNRSPSPHHQISKNPSETDAFQYPGQNKSTQSSPNSGVPTATTNSPVRYRNNHDRNRDRERPTSCRYEYERNYERIYSQPVESLSRSEENMLAPKSSPHRDYRDRDIPPRDRDMNRPRSALAHESYRAHGGSTRSLTGSRDHLPSRSRSRPMSTDLDQLAEEFENVAIDKKRSHELRRPSVSELVNRLGGAANTNSGSPPPDGARDATKRDPTTQFSSSRSNSIPKTLHSISEMPSNLVPPGSVRSSAPTGSEKHRSEQIIPPSRSGSDRIARSGSDRSSERSFQPIRDRFESDRSGDSPNQLKELIRRESVNSSKSASSSVGPDSNFPPPPIDLMPSEDVYQSTGSITGSTTGSATGSGIGDENSKSDVPDDIKITMQKIRNSSRDPEPEIEFIPEPPTEDMPSRYFEPAILAKLQNDGGNQSESEQESSSSHEGASGRTAESRLSDKQNMIKTHEEAVINFTADREELIRESRQNEAYGEEIMTIIKSKCPSILGKLQPFVEDIQSNYKLTVQLNGRITRAEAARAEAENLDPKTKEVCEQKIKALRAQQLEAERLNNHCVDRERIVTDCLRQHLARDDFLKFEKYIHHKREILKEQYMIEERIKGAELILKQLKES